ncbi:MAG TPA: 30S ribosome-binding factor RbfA [Porphyromonadaceae bacterium]|nr:30S ribosome-binding factor RbfA [Porphyromonadaceae bacterium]
MEGTRLNKIERLLQKELSELFRRQTVMMRGILVTVSRVRVSPDLSVAKIYLSIFPSEKGGELIESIEKNKKTLRYDLGQIVRMQLRRIPELVFYLDDSLDYVENIDKLLKK